MPKQIPHLPFLLYVCIASALGGFVWGFDAIVISGTISQVKEQFSIASQIEGLFVSSGLIGAVIGAAAAGYLSDRFGRARNLVLASVLMWLSAVASGFAWSIESLIVARWLGGIGVGIAGMVCPLYISELSPAHLRGRMVTVFQFAITIGILVALVSNAWLHGLAEKVGASDPEGFWKWFLVEDTWRSMFASELVPGTLFLVLSLGLPESPRWLVKSGHVDQAGVILGKVLKVGAEEELQAIEQAVQSEKSGKARYVDVFATKYRKSLIVAVMLAVFAQFSGINVVFYYGPSILEKAGFELGGALGGFATIGFCNMLFTIVAIAVVDRLGRRPLMIVGTVGAIVCLCGIGLYLESESFGLLIALICGFVAFFAFSLGPIKFIFASEIFPTSIRAHAVSVVVLSVWLADALLGQFFPLLRDSFGANVTFFIFAVILVPQIWMVWKHMPETAGRSLEEIEAWWKGR